MSKDIEFTNIHFSSPKASSTFRIEHVPLTSWAFIQLSNKTEEEKLEQLADVIYYHMPEDKQNMFLML